MAVSDRGRGFLTSTEDRKNILDLITEAVTAGCRHIKACEAFNIKERTIQRWRINCVDNRRGPITIPANKLSETEKDLIIKISVSTKFVNLSPHQIVPKLADEGIYMASESTFYRVLREAKLNTSRGHSKPRIVERPKSYEATGANQIYSWDITYLPSLVRGQFYYLYLFMDIFSRKVVGWRIHEVQEADLSSLLLEDICKTEKINPFQVVLHSDNGSPMKGSTMRATMDRLKVTPSYSRPSVSDDNPFSESMFKTVKYCPLYPAKPFDSLNAATDWMEKFSHWYNTEHLHSGINFVTPESKHKGNDNEILKNRDHIYKQAQAKNPNRWSGKTRNWNSIIKVKLNPLKEKNKSIITSKLKQVC